MIEEINFALLKLTANEHSYVGGISAGIGECYALVLSFLSFKIKNMYTTKNTKCSNFTCEIRTQCKRSELSINDWSTPFCFAYSKKKKYCKLFIPKN